MKKMFKPAYLALYLLVLVVFFVIGVYVAALLGAAENKGLAGGAIVFWWGILFSFFALVAMLFIVKYLAHKTIVKMNWLLLVIMLILYGITHYRFTDRQKEKERIEKREKEEWEQRKNKKALESNETSLLLKKQDPNSAFNQQSSIKYNSLSF